MTSRSLATAESWSGPRRSRSSTTCCLSVIVHLLTPLSVYALSPPAPGAGQRLPFRLPEAEHGARWIDDDAEPAHVRDRHDVLHDLRTETGGLLSRRLDIGNFDVGEPG